MFKRRQPSPPVETVKVADVVQAYYDAGRRPSNSRFPTQAVPVPAEIEPEPVEQEPPAAEQVVDEAEAEAPVHAEAAPTQKSLDELADELEAFIEAIRYGDNLGSAEVLSGALAT